MTEINWGLLPNTENVGTDIVAAVKAGNDEGNKRQINEQIAEGDTEGARRRAIAQGYYTEYGPQFAALDTEKRAKITAANEATGSVAFALRRMDPEARAAYWQSQGAPALVRAGYPPESLQNFDYMSDDALEGIVRQSLGTKDAIDLVEMDQHGSRNALTGQNTVYGEQKHETIGTDSLGRPYAYKPDDTPDRTFVADGSLRRRGVADVSGLASADGVEGSETLAVDGTPVPSPPAPPEEAAPATETYMDPLGGRGRPTSGYGQREAPIRGASTNHLAQDTAVPVGTPVVAPMSGRVIVAGPRGNGGISVIIQHADGSRTGYAHLSSADVRVGDTVTQGQVVAKSGNTGNSTGPHLHHTYTDPQGNRRDPAAAVGREGPSTQGAQRQTAPRQDDVEIGVPIETGGGRLTYLGPATRLTGDEEWDRREAQADRTADRQDARSERSSARADARAAAGREATDQRADQRASRLPPVKQAEAAAKLANAQRIRRTAVAMLALEEQGLPAAGTGIVGGRIAGDFLGETAQRYDSYGADMTNGVTAITRVQGVGSQSDYEARLSEARMPQRSQPREQRIQNLRNIVGIIDSMIPVLTEQAQGGTGVVAATGPAPAPAAPREGDTKQLSSGRTVTFRGGRWQ